MGTTTAISAPRWKRRMTDELFQSSGLPTGLDAKLRICEKNKTKMKNEPIHTPHGGPLCTDGPARDVEHPRTEVLLVEGGKSKRCERDEEGGKDKRCERDEESARSGEGVRRESFELGAGERLHVVAFVLGSGELSMEVNLVGPGAEFELDGLFVDNSSISLSVNHLSPNCTSRQLVKGIAVGSGAKGAFSGRIYVARDAQHTDAEQYNRNIVIGDGATITTRPQMEIYADDVRCAHGATIGELDREAVFYLRQRGLSEAEARRLLLEGFAHDIVNRCPSVDCRNTIAAKIDTLLSYV